MATLRRGTYWLALALVPLLLFLAFVAPTRYQRAMMRASGHPARVDRLSGKAEMLTAIGWRPVPRFAVITQ